MELSAEQIKQNWDIFLEYIKVYIKEPRKSQLLDFYENLEDDLILYPASNKKEFHNCFPGGYVDHVIRVIEGALELDKVWKKFGADATTYTTEELVFSALNHDLGKVGINGELCYIPQDDEWRKDKLGELYKFNEKIPFMSVPDRSLFILQDYDIKVSYNEMISIQIHDGLYDEANNKYLKTYRPETKLRTSLPYIIHQADLMAARVEFEKEWLPILGKDKVKDNKSTFKIKENKTPKSNIKNKALSSVTTEPSKYSNILNSINNL